jgi:hypothetical protein
MQCIPVNHAGKFSGIVGFPRGVKNAARDGIKSPAVGAESRSTSDCNCFAKAANVATIKAERKTERNKDT